MPAFEPSPAHAGPDPLDDEVALELSDGFDDDYHCAAQRAAGVEVLAEADELDLQVVELIEHLRGKWRTDGRSRSEAQTPGQDLEAAAAGIPKQFIETRPTRLRSGDPVDVLADDLETTLLGHRAEIVQLGLRMLVDGRDPHINSRSFHSSSSIEQSSLVEEEQGEVDQDHASRRSRSRNWRAR